MFFKLHQSNVPQKNQFFIYNWYLVHKNIALVKKLDKTQNYYKIDVEDYSKVKIDNIRKEYKR